MSQDQPKYRVFKNISDLDIKQLESVFDCKQSNNINLTAAQLLRNQKQIANECSTLHQRKMKLLEITDKIRVKINKKEQLTLNVSLNERENQTLKDKLTSLENKNISLEKQIQNVKDKLPLDYINEISSNNYNSELITILIDNTYKSIIEIRNKEQDNLESLRIELDQLTERINIEHVIINNNIKASNQQYNCLLSKLEEIQTLSNEKLIMEINEKQDKISKLYNNIKDTEILNYNEELTLNNIKDQYFKIKNINDNLQSHM